jgi:hypothetical protein
MICDFFMRKSGVSILMGAPSTPLLVASLAKPCHAR